MSFLPILLALAASLLHTHAIQNIMNPINLTIPITSQHPPLARTHQPYTFTLASSTFTNTPTAFLTYTATPLPTWLSFTSSNLSFCGTPAFSDVGAFDIILQATNPDGRILTDNFPLLVTEKQGNLSHNYPIADQIQSNDSAVTSAYPYPASSAYHPGVRVPPNWSFSIGFQPWTFTGNTRIFYSARLDDGSPLPEWMQFNNGSVTFDGVTPSNPGVYKVVLAGSDVLGYEDTSKEFNLVVAGHELMQGVGVFNYTIGEDVSMGGTGSILAGVVLDGSTIHKDQVVELDLETKGLAWLSVDGNYTLSGIPPAGQGNVDVGVGLVDKFGDRLNSTIKLRFYPSAFASSQIDSLVVNSTQPINIDLSGYFTDTNANTSTLIATSASTLNLSMTVNPSKASSWLNLDPTTKILSGTLPKSLDYDSVILNLVSQNTVTNTISRANMTLNLVTPDGTPPSVNRAHRGWSTATKAGIGAVAGLVAALVLLCAILALKRRNKARKENKVMVEGDSTDDLEGYKWENGGDVEYVNPETPAMDYSEKMGDPPSVQHLVTRNANGGYDPETGITLPHLDSSVDGTGKTGKSKKFLTNPFTSIISGGKRVVPKISNPIIMPDFSNAAFQAQLAAAVDSKGIVNRNSTFRSHSEDGDDSDGSTQYTRSGSRMDSDGTVVSGDTTSRTDSRMENGSSRASWESEAPFVWTGADIAGNGTEGSHEFTESSNAPTTEGGFGSTEDTPIQRREFAPQEQQREVVPVRYQVITPTPTRPSGGTSYASGEEGISIDNIHFPTDSDIAMTEASSENDVIIRTAARVDARRTLDSPGSIAMSSPASTASGSTEKGSTIMVGSLAGGGISPVMTTHSRLVSFGKKGVVAVVKAERTVGEAGRSVSQTGVVEATVSSGSGIRATSPTESLDSKESTPKTSGSKSRVETKGKAKSSKSASSVSSQVLPYENLDMERSVTPSPPSSLPSLPALPSVPTSPTPPLHAKSQRILLGVAEPFHFYPPLSLSPSSSTTTSHTTSTASSTGATYVAVLEKDEGVCVGLPSWLRFEGMELWGVPEEVDRGVWEVKILERRAGREKIVGKFALEVVGR